MLPTLVPFLLALLAGLILLAWSADRFVDGASGLAVKLGVSPMIVGLTIVAFGTSAPEILVSAMAALNGNPGLALGNAVGSNIANIGLVLGATALVLPLAVRSETLRREFPMMAVVMAFTLLLIIDGELSRTDGTLLLAGMFLLIGVTVRIGRQSHYGDPLAEELAAEQSPQIIETTGTGRYLWLLTGGLLILLLASRLLVWGAVGLASHFGISDLVIGLTIVAIGTSLPELAASLVAARKGEDDIAIGNVVGSNLFNLLAVIGVAGTMAPTTIDQPLLWRDYPIMLALTITLYLLARGSGSQPGKIGRLPGALLLLTFIGYNSWLYLHIAMP